MKTTLYIYEFSGDKEQLKEIIKFNTFELANKYYDDFKNLIYPESYDHSSFYMCSYKKLNKNDRVVK